MSFDLSEALKEIEGSRAGIQNLIREQRLTNGLLKLLLLKQGKDKNELLEKICHLESELLKEY